MPSNLKLGNSNMHYLQNEKPSGTKLLQIVKFLEGFMSDETKNAEELTIVLLL